MLKFVALFKQPPDSAEFMRRFDTEQLPLLLKVPGPTSAELIRLKRNSFGETPDYFQILTIGFPDQETFRTAALSPEWRSATTNLMEFADGLVSAYIGEA